MTYTIRNIDFLYNEKNEIANANIRFDIQGGMDIDVTGRVMISSEEYYANVTTDRRDMSALITLVKERFKTQIAGS